MLTLVLEGAIMLGLDVHVNSTLILLGKLAMRTLELARLCTDIFECHCGDFPNGGSKIQFFGVAKITDTHRMVCLKKIRIETRELQKAGILESYINKGFEYVKRIYPNTPNKFPTVGCVVELSHYRQQECLPIHSIKGQQLIQRLSYM
jgi:hypothetical protein